MTAQLDTGWLSAHPLPTVEGGQGKDERGQALVVGGSLFVPGAIRLTGEAVLRVGAGKVQLATVEESCSALGVAFPEAAVLRLQSVEGEIALEAVGALERGCANCDALILGPGMIEHDETHRLTRSLLRKVGETPSLVDAGAMTALRHVDCSGLGPLVVTPHHGELATMLAAEKCEIERSPLDLARKAAERFDAVVALKSAETVIVSPDGRSLRYVSPSAGLGTAGSGDVLAGVIGGLLARGVDVFEATGWGVWLHGEAGRAASVRHGTTGFLARELLGELPKVLDTLATAARN